MTSLAKDDAPHVILYGGTFDPPHAGHCACVMLVRQLFPLAIIDILPSPQTMQAGGGVKKPTASFEQRLQMCRLAFQDDMKLSGVDISDLEAKMPQPRYTVNLLQRFIAEHPGKRVALLMGMDQFKDFPSWYDPKAILAISDLVIVKRANGFSPELLAEVICDKLHYSYCGDVASGTVLIKETGRKLYLVDQDTSPAASSKIREEIEAGRQPIKGWLTESVAKYIEMRALYISGR